MRGYPPRYGRFDRPRRPSWYDGRLLSPRRWLAMRHRAGEARSAFGFGFRLFATVALTLTLTGFAAYVLLERNLADRQITDYAAAQQADAKAFEAAGSRARSATEAIREIDLLLDSVAKRPGTLTALLVDQHNVIRAEIKWVHVGEKVAASGPVQVALRQGRSFAGRSVGRIGDHRDFQFVTPVNLPSGRYAYEVIYDHRTYDMQLNQVRTILGLVGLVAMIGGGGLFYLLGGRRLMRDHRLVLRRATRDGLTDLSNHRAFQDELRQAVASAARYKEPLALLLLDIDDFKHINDHHGHPHGDSILKRVAGVLREARPGDRPYRIGGDEFAVLLAHTDAGGARTAARRLNLALAQARIDVSIGVSGMCPGLDADTLRAEADSALYEAKRRGGGQVVHFEAIEARVVVTTSERKEAVRRLIDEGRVTTAFQPIWNLSTESLVGVEALTRLDPCSGLSGPEEAFDVAEQLGRVHQLDVLCVESALRSAPELEPGVLLFINLSPLTLDLDAEADAWLRPAVEQVGLTPQSVVVEVTYRFGGHMSSVLTRLKRLREQGFMIALDDVGRGNSGLEMLCEVNAEFVKLDRSVVVAAATQTRARAVLMAMATFACQTGAFVIAEGIEDRDTLAFLRHLNADHQLSTDAIIQGGQGFGLGRPSNGLPPGSPALFQNGVGVLSHS